MYNEETVKTNWHIMNDHLIPRLSKASIEHPDDVSKIFKPVRGNYNAKSAIESAIWDLYAKENNMSLSKALGGVKDRIEVGVSIGIKESVGKLLIKLRITWMMVIKELK